MFWNYISEELGKFLWRNEIERGILKLPLVLRIKPGKWSGNWGSNMRGNVSAKGIGWGKRPWGRKESHL